MSETSGFEIGFGEYKFGLGADVLEKVGDGFKWIAYRRDIRRRLGRAACEGLERKLKSGENLNEQDMALINLFCGKDVRTVYNQELLLQNTQQVFDEVQSRMKLLPPVSENERRSTVFGERFENLASEATDDEVRQIYARVLAGEMSRPGSFSLRTLDVLHSMDRAVALGFDNLRRFAFARTEFGKGLVLLGSDELRQLVEQENKLTYKLRKELEDAGLMDPAAGTAYCTTGDRKQIVEYLYYDHVLRLQYLTGGTTEKRR
jgi:hypothetical protein